MPSMRSVKVNQFNGGLDRLCGIIVFCIIVNLLNKYLNALLMGRIAVERASRSRPFPFLVLLCRRHNSCRTKGRETEMKEIRKREGEEGKEDEEEGRKALN